jgi:hypothetical protein
MHTLPEDAAVAKGVQVLQHADRLARLHCNLAMYESLHCSANDGAGLPGY